MTIKDDIQKKRAQEMEAILIEINQCTKDYVDNRCEPETRLPPIEDYCMEKEKCMMQDPVKVVQASKMTALILAEILNEFVGALEVKTIIFFFIALFG